jgi:hypothetical protein
MELTATWLCNGETITIKGTLPQLAAEFARRGWTYPHVPAEGDRWTRAYDDTGRQRGWVQAGEWASA